MITVKIDARKVVKGLQNAQARIKKGVANALINQGQASKALALKLAPHKSGALKRGITYQALKTRVKIESKVPGKFPYNKWVNTDIIIKNLYPYGLPPVHKNVVYGETPSTASRNWNWTGTPGFMNFVALKAEQEIKGRIEKQIGKDLMR